MATMKCETYDGTGKLIASRDVEIPPERVNADAIHQRLRDGLQDNKDYLAIASPTAAQTAAHIKRLARRQNAIMRLLLGALDADD